MTLLCKKACSQTSQNIKIVINSRIKKCNLLNGILIIHSNGFLKFKKKCTVTLDSFHLVAKVVQQNLRS